MLEDGIESYENGAYGNAIRKLEDVADNPRADRGARVQALKYLAFSHCVSPDSDRNRKPPSHLTLCRQAFERALALDPTFELAQAERGHPVWGKQFQAARIAQSKKTSAGSASGTTASPSQPGSAAAKKSAPPSALGTSADTAKP
ncbi:MAG TPA: TssQ family T6SS-associated lipoprotein [Burkholderiales bacterium]|nr:TssQ family T6SS-associated lipoprotein [Burkholderiales bacterium]